METTVERVCPIPGFEEVTVTYNLMASEDALDAFQRSMGVERNEIIQDVKGWPGGEHGDDPFGKAAPILFRVWGVKQITEAIKEYISDPNF